MLLCFNAYGGPHQSAPEKDEPGSLFRPLDRGLDDKSAYYLQGNHNKQAYQHNASEGSLNLFQFIDEFVEFVHTLSSFKKETPKCFRSFPFFLLLFLVSARYWAAARTFSRRSSRPSFLAI
jgi:hypothetical protein